MKKVIDWFKGNWFLWVFLILFYIGLRISGYDIKIEKSEGIISSQKGRFD